MEEHTSPGMKETSLGRESREITAAPALNLQTWHVEAWTHPPLPRRGEGRDEISAAEVVQPKNISVLLMLPSHLSLCGFLATMSQFLQTLAQILSHSPAGPCHASVSPRLHGESSIPLLFRWYHKLLLKERGKKPTRQGPRSVPSLVANGEEWAPSLRAH